MSKQVLVLQGSESDSKTMQHACKTLVKLKIGYDALITSAHRTPDRMIEAAEHAESKGYDVIIAGAGGSAHLPGMVASHAMLPVIGVIVPSSTSPFMDFCGLGSTIGMPSGAPLYLAGFGEAGAVNAALQAGRILALFGQDGLRDRLEVFREQQVAGISLQPSKFCEAPTSFDPETYRGE